MSELQMIPLMKAYPYGGRVSCGRCALHVWNICLVLRMTCFGGPSRSACTDVPPCARVRQVSVVQVHAGLAVAGVGQHEATRAAESRSPSLRAALAFGHVIARSQPTARATLCPRCAAPRQRLFGCLHTAFPWADNVLWPRAGRRTRPPSRRSSQTKRYSQTTNQGVTRHYREHSDFHVVP